MNKTKEETVSGMEENFDFRFHPKQEHWVAFGDFEHGETLPINKPLTQKGDNMEDPQFAPMFSSRTMIHDAIRTIDPDHEVITLVGSTKFKEAFELANHLLSIHDKAVFTVSQFGHCTGLDMAGHIKKALDRSYLKKIASSDAIFVINPGGYVGVGGCDEIHYALAMGKHVYWLEEPEGWARYLRDLKASDAFINYFRTEIERAKEQIVVLCCEIWAYLQNKVETPDAVMTLWHDRLESPDFTILTQVPYDSGDKDLKNVITACNILRRHFFIDYSNVCNKLMIRFADTTVRIAYAAEYLPKNDVLIEFKNSISVTGYISRSVKDSKDLKDTLFWLAHAVKEFDIIGFNSVKDISFDKIMHFRDRF